jgi:hypothetical protein
MTVCPPVNLSTRHFVHRTIRPPMTKCPPMTKRVIILRLQQPLQPVAEVACNRLQWLQATGCSGFRGCGGCKQPVACNQL